MSPMPGWSRLQRTGAAAVILVGLIAACGGGGAAEPRLVTGATVANDFSELAASTFEAFVDAAPGLADCMGEVRLEAATVLADAAQYSRGTRTITVRVPATAPSLSDSLVHELAHHLETACGTPAGVRAAFAEAQGLDPTRPWFGGTSWEQTPSEQFAETVVLVVLGQRRRNVGGIPITPSARSVVADWLAGR